MENVCILCHTNAHAVELYPSNVQEKHLNVEIFSARRMPDRLHGRILRCKQCGLVYTSPLVDPAVLSKLYEVSKYTYGEEETHIKKTYARYLRKLMRALGDQPRPWSYLDIGCGNGFMLEAGKDLGFDEVWGVEPSSHAIEKAHISVRQNILQGMFSPELIGGHRYTAISCFQTLDHIQNPEAFVRQCFDALEPGGAVLFINHNIASLAARILGERCPMIDIEHTYLHTFSTMRALFARCGFGQIDTFPVRNDYPLHYWFHLLPLPKKLKHALVGPLRNSAVGNIVIALYPGNLGLIARKPR